MAFPSPRETHTRLYVNGQYAGLYGLVESVDKTMMGRVFGSIGDNVQNDGYLFEYNYVLGSAWRFSYEGADLAPYKARFDIKTNESHAESHDLGADRRARPARQQHIVGVIRADDRTETRSRGVCALHRRAELSSRRTMASTATTG